MELLSEQLSRMGEIMMVNEAYLSAPELEQLAKELLWIIAKANTGMVERIVTKGMRYAYLTTDDFWLKQLPIQVEKYVVLKPWLSNTNLDLKFMERMGTTRGAYNHRQESIYLNKSNEEFEEFLDWTASKVKPDENGKVDEMAAYTALGIAFERAFKNTLVHELQHAYDDWRSHGKFQSDDKSKRYYQRLRDYHQNKEKGEPNLPKEEQSIYLSLPHEYWARFTQAVQGMSTSTREVEDWDTLLDRFKWNIQGFDFMGPNDQKRVVKAFYKFCTLHNLVRTREDWEKKPIPGE